MSPRFFIPAAVALSLALGGRAEAAKVVGKITVTAEFRHSLAGEESKAAGQIRSGYWNEPNSVRDVEPPYVVPSSDFGIALFPDGAIAGKPDDLTEVDVRAGGLDKNVVVVRPGTAVKFRSIDPFDHELYVESFDDFKPEKQSRGAFRTIEFAHEGIYEVRCRLVPHFRGWVVVTPAPYVLKADASGVFSQDGLPVGKYTLRIFFRGRWIAEQKFQIENERGDFPVEVKIDVPKAPGSAPAAPAPAPAAEEGKAAAQTPKKPEDR